MPPLFLYDTLTRERRSFAPLDPANIRMYVCGPTVYDRAHLGNARSVVVYDVLYRLLKHLHPTVTYVRNITDVEDKINAAAKASGEPISVMTARVTNWFHEDMKALGVLPTTLTPAPINNPEKATGQHIEPKATDHIEPMIKMIERLVNNGNAYVADGHVLFAVGSASKNPSWHYGMLSGRVQDELEAGARVKVESYKKHPHDFVLWKPAEEGDPEGSVFDCGSALKALGVKAGRPGWHIECSAMSMTYLGETFDIHGGGADLMFPHHENEIAQSCCAYPQSQFAKYWVHNGFLTVNGEKMSKSLGNFVTVRDLLDKGVKGEVIRLALLSSKYNEPLDWNDKLVHDAQKAIDSFYRALEDFQESPQSESQKEGREIGYQNIEFFLGDDLNMPVGIRGMHECVKAINTAASTETRNTRQAQLKTIATFLGLLSRDAKSWFKGEGSDDTAIQSQIDARIAAKKAKNWKEADRIRDELKAQGILLEDRPDGTSDWRRG